MEGSGYGLIHVAIGEDDVWALPAQFKRCSLQSIGRALGNQLGRIHVTRERDLVDVGMSHHGIAGGFTHPVEQIDDTGRKARFLHQLAHSQNRKRRLFGRLHDNGVTAGQSRTPLPCRHQQRKVPGNDLAHDANGLAKGIGQEVAPNRDRFSFDLVGPAREISQTVHNAAQVAASIGNRLAAIQRFQPSQLFGICLDQIGQLEHQLAAITGIHSTPGSFFEGLTSGFDGGIDVLFRRMSDLGNGFARGGIISFERCAVRGIAPFVINEQLRLSRKLRSSRGSGKSSAHDVLSEQSQNLKQFFRTSQIC